MATAAAARRDAGFSLLEVVIALFVLGLMATVTLSSIGAADNAVAATRARDGATSLASQLLQQAAAWGCETETGMEDPSTGTLQGASGNPSAPDALANVYSRCDWTGSLWNNTANYIMAPTVPLVGSAASSCGSGNGVNAIGTTPWMCMVAQNDLFTGSPTSTTSTTQPVNPQIYAVQVSASIQTPGYNTGICTSYGPTSVPPAEIITTVQVIWWVDGATHTSFLSSVAAVPADSAYWHAQPTGVVDICTASPAAVALAIPQAGYTGSCAGTPVPLQNQPPCWYIVGPSVNQATSFGSGTTSTTAPATTYLSWYPQISPTSNVGLVYWNSSGGSWSTCSGAAALGLAVGQDEWVSC